MILIIDNYDSFVYNLYQAFGSLGCDVRVKRNDEVTVEEVLALKPARIILSPGPGHPANKKDFGVCDNVLSAVRVPILGVCLGQQGIITHFNGTVEKAPKPMHGKTSQVEHNGKGLFNGLPNPLRVMRYHSLAGTKIPDCLEITAKCMDDGVTMAVQHKTRPIYGVQFHPESIMTEDGKQILENFLRL